MNRNYNTSGVTESAMITGILVIIAYLSSFFSVAMFFYPTPAIILAKRKGLKYAALSLIASDLIISMLLGIQTGLVFFILYTPFSIALSYGICKDKEANRTILYGTASYLISFVILVLLLDLIIGVNFIQQMQDIYAESLDMMKEMLNNYPAGSVARVEEMKKVMDSIDPMIITIVFPAMLIISSVIVSYINYSVAGRFAGRFKIKIRAHEGLGYFSFPKTFMIAMAVMLLISYLMSTFKINVNAIQLNLFLIMIAAMYLQGVAVVKMYLIKRQLSKSLQNLMTGMVVVLSLFVFAGAMIMIAMLGLVDLTVDLRKLNKIV